MSITRVVGAASPGPRGEWTFVVGRGFLAAVRFDAPAAIVSRLVALVSELRVDLESVVAQLPLNGEQAIDDFVVIVPGEATGGRGGIPVSAIVRGAVAVDVFSVGGACRFTDRGIRPWLLADFQSVVGVAIGSPAVRMVAPELLDSGQRVGLGSVLGNTLFWSVISGVDDDTVLRPRRSFEDTVILRRRGRTDAARGPESGGALPRVLPPTLYGFRLPGGETYALDAVYILGRNPRPPRILAGSAPRLLAVPSHTKAVSGTHLEISQEGDSVVVRDLGSTNGTIVTSPLGRTERIRPAQSLVVVPGTRIDMGDGNIVEILSASILAP